MRITYRVAWIDERDYGQAMGTTPRRNTSSCRREQVSANCAPEVPVV